MGFYKIGDFVLNFTFTNNQLIQERIEKFKILNESKYDFKMECTVVNSIDYPNGKLVLKYQNKMLYHLEDDLWGLCVIKEDVIHTLVRYDKAYQNVQILFNECLGDKISEFEYVLTGIIFNSMMATKSIISLHASAISYNNDGIMFSASSGTGKSTHTGLWKLYKDDVMVINDDKPLIRYKNNQFEVIGSPWSGKTPQNENIIVPLKAICFLSQAKVNKVHNLSSSEKLLFLLKNVHRPTDEELYQNVLTIINLLVKKIPMYHLECDISSTAVETIYNKIYEEKDL